MDWMVRRVKSANALSKKSIPGREDHVQRPRGRKQLGYSWNRRLSRSCPRESGVREEAVGKAADGEETCRLGEGVGLYSEHKGKEVLE